MNEKIIVEIKAIKTTTEKHEAQVINYLKASKLKLGILANFGAYPKATVKRFAL
jgi:GxxExxY protein